MTEPTIIDVTATPSPQGPVDPNVVTVLEGSDDSVHPSPELIAMGAAGDVEALQTTPQGLDHARELNDQVGQSDPTG